jgi:uncharacterized phage protein (TIGR01671 family)
LGITGLLFGGGSAGFGGEGMREIEFRAWDKDREEWCKGYSSSPGMYLNGHDEVFELEAATSFVYGNGKRNIEIMQFTGLQDKNGKKVYEGDILKVKFEGINPYRHEYEVMKVVWLQGIALGRFVVIDKNGESWSGLSNTEIEVIGNIYENPSLMEAVK